MIQYHTEPRDTPFSKENLFKTFRITDEQLLCIKLLHIICHDILKMLLFSWLSEQKQPTKSRQTEMNVTLRVDWIWWSTWNGAETGWLSVWQGAVGRRLRGTWSSRLWGWKRNYPSVHCRLLSNSVFYQLKKTLETKTERRWHKIHPTVAKWHEM